jgi:hypothetical protein
MKKQTYVEMLDALAMEITNVWSTSVWSEKARSAYHKLLRVLRKLDKERG